MELESQVEAFRKRGLGVAALSYDSVGLLKDFAARRKITFPLLSDSGSKVIRAFGLLNEADYPVGHSSHGVPYPGTFVVDAKGTIRQKAFERRYQERRTAASLLATDGANPGPWGAEIKTAQFTLKTSVSNPDAAPGQRITLILDVEMAPLMHAYAPGVKTYKPLALRLDPNPFVTPHDVSFPEAKGYTFEPLNETVPVFEGAFRVLLDVTVLTPQRSGASSIPSAIQMTEIDLNATLDFQVCSDKVCYAPDSLRLNWAIRIKPLDRERPPEALRHKQ